MERLRAHITLDLDQSRPDGLTDDLFCELVRRELADSINDRHGIITDRNIAVSLTMPPPADNERIVIEEFSRMERGGITITRDAELTLARRVARRLRPAGEARVQ